MVLFVPGSGAELLLPHLYSVLLPHLYSVLLVLGYAAFVLVGLALVAGAVTVLLLKSLLQLYLTVVDVISLLLFFLAGLLLLLLGLLSLASCSAVLQGAAGVGAAAAGTLLLYLHSNLEVNQVLGLLPPLIHLLTLYTVLRSRDIQGGILLYWQGGIHCTDTLVQ